jgi:hypothetical protein
VLKKTSILLKFDEEALLSLRRILFKNGLGAQEFFAFIIERMMLNDERIETLIEDLCELKTEDMMKGGVNRKNINADTLYEAIEAQLKKDTNNDVFEED